MSVENTEYRETEVNALLYPLYPRVEMHALGRGIINSLVLSKAMSTHHDDRGNTVAQRRQLSVAAVVVDFCKIESQLYGLMQVQPSGAGCTSR